MGTVREEPRWLLAGMVFGLAISVKVLGGIWLFAALLARPPWPHGFHAHFTRRFPPQGQGGPQLWEQLSQ